MDPLTMMLIMGGLGMLKSEAIDKPAANRKRDLAATTQELSPWTGLSAQPVFEPDTFGTALQYAGTGASMGSAMEDAAMNKQLKEKMLKSPANAKTNTLYPTPWGDTEGLDVSDDPFNNGQDYNTGVMGTKLTRTPWG